MKNSPTLGSIIAIRDQKRALYDLPGDLSEANNFATAAAMIDLYLSARPGGKNSKIDDVDLPIMITLLKISRIAVAKNHHDNYCDAANYIVLAGDRQLEKQERNERAGDAADAVGYMMAGLRRPLPYQGRDLTINEFFKKKANADMGTGDHAVADENRRAAISDIGSDTNIPCAARDPLPKATGIIGYDHASKGDGMTVTPAEEKASHGRRVGVSKAQVEAANIGRRVMKPFNGIPTINIIPGHPEFSRLVSLAEVLYPNPDGEISKINVSRMQLPDGEECYDVAVYIGGIKHFITASR